MKKRMISLIIALCLLLPLATFPASAAENTEYDLTKGHIVIGPGFYAGDNFSVTQYVDDINKPISKVNYAGKTMIVITSNATETFFNITIAAGGTVNLTLRNVNIAAFDKPALWIQEGTGRVNLTLSGTNKLTVLPPLQGAAFEKIVTNAALQKDSKGASSLLTIKGGGILTATGKDYGAGIGGGRNGSAEYIAIESGTVNATGGRLGGAGIGGGASTEDHDAGSGLFLSISGGIVNATGGQLGGAGIGGGRATPLKAITDQKGNGNKGASGGSCSLLVSGGEVNAVAISDGAPGIGGTKGAPGGAATDISGAKTAGSGGSGGDCSLTVTGGRINATGATGAGGGAAIGGSDGAPGGTSATYSGGNGGNGGNLSLTVSGGVVVSLPRGTDSADRGGYWSGTGAKGGNAFFYQNQYGRGGNGGNGGNCVVQITGGSIENLFGAGGGGAGGINTQSYGEEDDYGQGANGASGDVWITDDAERALYPLTASMWQRGAEDSARTPLTGKIAISAIPCAPGYGVKDLYATETLNQKGESVAAKLYLWFPRNTMVDAIQVNVPFLLDNNFWAMAASADGVSPVRVTTDNLAAGDFVQCVYPVIAPLPLSAPVIGDLSAAYTVSLSCATAGAVIYYTLDNTDPKTSPSRALYAGPVQLYGPRTLRAAARVAEKWSEETSKTFSALIEVPANIRWDGTTARWNASGGAAGYTLELYKSGAQGEQKIGTYSLPNAGTLSYDFSAQIGQDTSSFYSFRVQALGSAYNSPWSAMSGLYAECSVYGSVLENDSSEYDDQGQIIQNICLSDIPVQLFQDGRLVAETTTDADGVYNLQSVLPGPGYTLVIKRVGYTTYTSKPFQLTQGATEKNLYLSRLDRRDTRFIVRLMLDGAPFTGQSVSGQAEDETTLLLAETTPGVYSGAAYVPNIGSEKEYTIYLNGNSTGATYSTHAITSSSRTLRLYTVSFQANGASTTPASRFVMKNDLITAPEALAKPGSTFLGWYSDAEMTKPWTFASSVVTEPTTLYAKWFDGAVTNTVRFVKQPAASLSVTEGTISGSLTASAAVSPSGTAELHWHACSPDGLLSGPSLGTGETFEIPAELTHGTHYFLCQATASGALPVNSEVAAVMVVIHPPASENRIDGVEAGQIITNKAGVSVEFDAVGAGMNNTAPILNDMRWGPTDWTWGEVSSGSYDRFDYGSNVFHRADFTYDKHVGQYAITINFAQQRFTGTGWDNTGITDTKTVSFYIVDVHTPTYPVTYKPGSKADLNQPDQNALKYKDYPLVLLGSAFTRSGYTQSGWTDTDGGQKKYELGESYTANAELTLYPVWSGNVQLFPPQNPIWDSAASGVLARWDAVEGATGYTVQLLLVDESSASGFIPVGEAVTVDANTLFYDFLAMMAHDGDGFYVFQVMALGDGTNSSSSLWSDTGDGYAYTRPAIYPVTLTISLNGAAYAGQTFTLQGNSQVYGLKERQTGIYYAEAVPAGSYTLYQNGTPVGVTVAVMHAAVAQTVEFFTVSFQANGGIPAPASQIVLKNALAAEPAAMVNGTDTFEGWFSDSAFQNAWNFSTGVAAMTTLHAKWSPTIPKTVSPTTNNASVNKMTEMQASVNFFLTNQPVWNQEVTWRVYDELGNVITNVKASNINNVLTLSHEMNLPVGSYGVTAQMKDYLESDRLILTVNDPEDAGMAGNEIICIQAEMQIFAGERVEFTAVCDSVTPILDAYRCWPTAWLVTQVANAPVRMMRARTAYPSGNFNTGWTQSFSTADMAAGQYALSVTFAQQRYNGAAWVATGVTDTQTLEFALNPAAAPIQVQIQPSDQYVVVGQQATFSLAAAGDQLTYQWFVNRNNGSGWRMLEGAVSAGYTTAVVALSNDGYQYKCRITNAKGKTLETAVAKLHVSETMIPPQTGDASTPGLWLAMCLLGSAGLWALVIGRRRKT